MQARYERKDVCLMFAELQPSIIMSSRTMTDDALIKTVSIAVDIANNLNIPIIASGVQMAPNWPVEMIEPLKGFKSYVRSTTSMFDDEAILKSLAEYGRSTLAIGGISSEIAILHSTLAAIERGFNVHVLCDCCGGLSARTEGTAFRQMENAGAIISNLSSFFTGLAPRLDDATAQVVYSPVARLWGWDLG